MKTRFLISLALFNGLVGAGTLAADEVSYYDGWLFNDYYVNGKKINKMAIDPLAPLENALLPQSQALNQFKQGEMTYGFSSVFIGLGIGLILRDVTWTLVKDDNMQRLMEKAEIPYDQFNRGFIYAGLALLTVGFPLRVLSHSQIGKAIDMYNGKPTHRSGLALCLSCNGIGMQYRY